MLHEHVKPGTPLHTAAKERKREAVKFLIENGAFLPDNIDDSRFNPPLHYCPGLEWAYEEMERFQKENLSAGETSYSSETWMLLLILSFTFVTSCFTVLSCVQESLFYLGQCLVSLLIWGMLYNSWRIQVLATL